MLNNFKRHGVRLRSQAELLRCIVGPLPFRRLTISPSWLTPNVLVIAGATYQDRGFDRMAVLGDSLEDADCDNSDILTHCRSGTEHARGCWVIDAVLGKS